MTTKLPSIPDFDGSNIKEVLNALKETSEIRVGHRGDKKDAGVTFRDLEALKLVQPEEDAVTTEGGSVSRTSASTLGGRYAVPAIRVPTYNPGTDFTQPPPATQLFGTAVFDTVLLTWNVVGFPNPSFWEIYRAFVDDVAQAQRIGTSTSQNFTDKTGGEAKTYYYWVKTVSAAGVRSAWNSSKGTAVTTGVPVAVVLKALENQILESSLNRVLAERLNDAEAGSGLANARITAEAKTRAQQILAEAVARGAAITQEANTRQTADQSLSQQITTVTAAVNSNAAAIQTETTARIAGDSTVAEQVTTLASQVQNAGYATTVAVQQNFYAKASGQSLEGQYTVKIDLNGHVSGFGLASSAVNDTPTSAFIVRADKFAIVEPGSSGNSLNNNPLSYSIPFFVTGGSTFIKSAFIQNASIDDAKIGSVSAKKITAGYVNATIGFNGAQVYGAQLYAGGSVSVSYDGQGFATGFSANNPTFKVENGDVEVVAANFRIKTQAFSSTTITPFEVVNGVVRITNAAIGVGTITMANIAEVIQSDGYYSGSSSGWQITKSGAATFNDATIRGVLKSSDNNFIIDLKNKFISISV